MRREKAQTPVNGVYTNTELRRGSLNQVKAIVKVWTGQTSKII